VLRHADGELVNEDEVLSLARWVPGQAAHTEAEYPFLPARVLLQDFTGVPAVVDLAAMRSAVARMGADPQQVNPLVPADLVIDHSVQVDLFGSTLAFARNVEREYERNGERYGLLRWGQQAFRNFRVVPPGTGIVHQVNLEYLASVVMTKQEHGETLAFPDTLVGTDSHTPMINGLGVLGWGVGGIEAEAVLLGQPIYLLTPEVIGVRLAGALPEGATATDLVLTVTQLLRKRGVVGKFVEFTGAGLSSMTVADRATISNMSPEFGATATLFPVDEQTLRYRRTTGRDPQLVELVERYTKLGVRAVIAESFERIHRSNLVGMGILPLQFKAGENKESLGLTGREVYNIEGIENGLKPRQEVTVKVTREDGSTFSFSTIARLDSPIEVTYYENGGILLTVLRRLLKA
jgi:aconitate hydratase